MIYIILNIVITQKHGGRELCAAWNSVLLGAVPRRFRAVSGERGAGRLRVRRRAVERATAGRGEAQHSGAPLREGTFKLQRKENLREAGRGNRRGATGREAQSSEHR
jgi:hypothetical protein